jgi:hypothetical protein
MTAHELAKKLLEMPNKEVFLDVRKIKGLENVGSMDIKEVKLCECGAEIFIYIEKE